MKSVRPDLPATMEEAMGMPHIVQVPTRACASAASASCAAHVRRQAVTAWASAEAEPEDQSQ